MRKLQKRIMAGAVILFSFFSLSAFSQCLENNQSLGTEIVEGIVNQNNNFYRNLIIQDIALASQQNFNEVSIRFDYKVNFNTDQCDANSLKMRVMPVCVKCYPLMYRDFNISTAVRPEKVDLSFLLINEMDILVDSVLFLDIPLQADSNLYTLRRLSKDPKDGHLTARLSRAVFHFTRRSYDDFRDKILGIDWYYAAATMADTALSWCNSGPLKETDDLPLLVLRQFEIEWILRHIQPRDHYLEWNDIDDDFAGLKGKISELQRLNRRYQTLITRYAGSLTQPVSMTEFKVMLTRFLGRLEDYDNMSFTGDFRNVPFMDEISSPVVPNGFLNYLSDHLAVEHGVNPGITPELGSYAAASLYLKGLKAQNLGDQLRALEYFESAFKISLFSSNFTGKDSIHARMCLMKAEVVNSYLGISKKAFIADNPAMAANYFRQAASLVDYDGYSQCDINPIEDYQQWLYNSFYEKAKEQIRSGKFRKAMLYLEEINSICANGNGFKCPDDLPEVIRQARQGIYNEVIAQAVLLWQREDFEESEMLLHQASGLRMVSGYAIARDAAESKLEGAANQKRYDEFLEQGIKNLDWREYNIALYYFNKAEILERGLLPHPDPRLSAYRQAAARQVILTMMSDTRARAYLYDFEGYQANLQKVHDMIVEYGFSNSDELYLEYQAMQNDASVLLCKKVREEYQSMLGAAMQAKKEGDYILARKRAVETVQYSLDHLSCGLDDSQAWYEKVILEPLALFQEKEEKMKRYPGVTSMEFLESYKDLSAYYHKNNLLEEGVVLKSFHWYIMNSNEIDFLKEMCDYYIRQRSLEKSLDVLKRMKSLNADPGLVEAEQKELAQIYAQRDAVLKDGREPWDILDSYVEKDQWYAEFRHTYRMTWLKATDANMRYWPFIWKK